jgi:hypothetical protein
VTTDEEDLHKLLERHRRLITADEFDLAKVGLQLVDEARTRWWAEVQKIARSGVDAAELKRLGIAALDREMERAKRELSQVHAAHAELHGGSGNGRGN